MGASTRQDSTYFC